MLLNYVKLSLRLLARNPFFTFINVAGLSVGYAVFYILWPFTQSELKSDQFIKDYERIARPVYDFRWTDNGGESWGHLNIGSVQCNTAIEMRNHSSVEDVTRFIPQFWFSEESTGLSESLIATVEREGQPFNFKIEKSICADGNFFEFFNLPFIQGDAAASLSLVDAMVISKKKSLAFFGNENPMGKLVRVNGKAYQITGVFEDLPHNSHLEFDIVFSNVGKLKFWNGPSEDFWMTQYFKMKGDPSLLADILNENKERLLGLFLEKNPHIEIDYTSQPLSEIAFSQNYSADTFRPKSKFMLNVLAGVSLVVLMMAWMNYVNLTVSRARTRFKEIATRKVSGALLFDLFYQFICQSAVINILAVLIGLTIVQVIRVPFDHLLNIRVLSIPALRSQTILFFLAVFIIAIIATATYPAWITLRQTTRQLLTKDIPSRKRILTTVFTTTQYVAALSLIAWIFIMNDQLTFILNKDLGVNRENVVVVDAPSIGLEESGPQKMKDFATQLENESGLNEITLSAAVSGEFPFSAELRRVGSDVFYGIDTQGGVDEKFIEFYHLKLLAGRNFVKDEKNQAIIISRFTAERLGFKTLEEAIGSIIEQNVGRWIPLEIIGVIEDYRVRPFLMEEGSTESITGRGECLTYLNSVWPTAKPLRVSLRQKNGDNIPEVISNVNKIFDQNFPGNIFKWYFLDESIGKQYGDQKLARNQITFFTALAVGVACLGLLGMISNKVAEKIKEISVRKILGAGNNHILSLLLSSTGAQIGVALMVGLPIAWKFSNQYLEKYTDRIELQWWHFALPAIMLSLIMLITIAGVLWKAAKTNPVEALKYE